MRRHTFWERWGGGLFLLWLNPVESDPEGLSRKSLIICHGYLYTTAENIHT